MVEHIFATKTIFFPPLSRRVTILLQREDGPCLLIALFNCLVLKGTITIESGVYPYSAVIDILSNVQVANNFITSNAKTKHSHKSSNNNITENYNDNNIKAKSKNLHESNNSENNINSDENNFEMNNDRKSKHHHHIHGLKKLIKGFYVNPSFDSCFSFANYPSFLEKLGIQMVHAMVPEKRKKNFKLISKYNFDSLQFRLVELDGFSTNNSEDELKVLRAWNDKLNRRIVTSAGVKQICDSMSEGDAQIFFRSAHFTCIYKHHGSVFSLITCHGRGNESCAWHSLPTASGEFQYFDERFAMTFCKPWESCANLDGFDISFVYVGGDGRNGSIDKRISKKKEYGSGNPSSKPCHVESSGKVKALHKKSGKHSTCIIS